MVWDRYKVSEWNDIIVIGYGTFTSAPTISVSEIPLDESAIPTSLAPLDPTCTLVHAGATSSVAIWYMERGKLSAPEAIMPAHYVWSMFVGGECQASGGFIVEPDTYNDRIPVYSEDTTDKIICVGEGLPARCNTGLELYRLEGLSPSSGGVRLHSVSLGSPECTESGGGIDGLDGVYFWTSVDDSASVTNPYEPTMYLWVMTTDDPARKTHGFFMVSASGEQTDYSGDFNGILAKLNEILPRRKQRRSPFLYPGKVT
jgi:hypothetical protein